ncbi:NADase-type glycan-binding domain-containing protein [Streptomyces sp. NPDC090022]|uniref:NADase-type glycan-binding domain-containing protein n=1 Tax=Streptomyces sp. NPDC090022 TaxID=3365920 RepID=UPI0037FD4C53
MQPPGDGGAAAARPVQRRHLVEEGPPQAGDLICGQCGVGNVPSRKYCRRCGSSLADAPVVPRPPWWRRLLPRRPRRTHAAGERPRRPRQWRLPRFVLPVVVLLALAGTGYLFRTELLGVVDAVRDRISDPQQFHAVAVTASSARPGHEPGLAVDGTTDKYWAPATAGPGEFLEAGFPGPVRLLDLVVRPGASPVAETFLQQGRPSGLLLTATTADGRTVTRTVRLADVPGQQRFHFAVSDVVRLRLTVQGGYGTADGRPPALAEVEFFKRP